MLKQDHILPKILSKRTPAARQAYLLSWLYEKQSPKLTLWAQTRLYKVLIWNLAHEIFTSSRSMDVAVGIWPSGGEPFY